MPVEESRNPTPGAESCFLQKRLLLQQRAKEAGSRQEGIGLILVFQPMLAHSRSLWLNVRGSVAY